MLNSSYHPPLVTVISVTYNSAKYVSDTIESVLGQSYRHIEYIIADDHSADETWQIIERYTDTRIIKYRNELNLGEYANRNKAIQLATGKYLIFIDGDDIIYPHSIENFVFYLEQYPDACMAIQKGYYNNLVFPFQLTPKEQYINYFFGDPNLLISSFASNFFRTTILQQHGLSVRYKSGDDEIRLRLASRYPVLYIPGWNTWPRETPGQASSKIPEEVAVLQLREYLQNILKENNEISGDAALVAGIKSQLNELLRKTVARKFKKLKFSKAVSILRESETRYWDLIRTTPSATSFSDITHQFTPENPFKRAKI